MFCAFYRCLYGEDFINESIASVINKVDKVFILLAHQPWGGADRCTYRGSTVYFPRFVDQLPEIVFEIQQKNPKVDVLWAYNDLNRDVVPWAVKTITNHYLEPHRLLFMEPDMVWKKSELERFIDIYENSSVKCLTAGQIELWRRFDYRVPYRAGRASSFLLDLKDTTRSGDLETTDALVHNLGFCISDRNMFWKHMLGLGISGPLGDSHPNEDWFEKTWLNWNPVTNNSNLEISRGAEHNLTHAFPYNSQELPELVSDKLGNKWLWTQTR